MEPAGKYVKTNAQDPSAYGICDVCGLRFNHRDLTWNHEWSGTHLYNTHSLRCWRCIDVPQEQWRVVILPSDPPPIINARVENFAYEEQTPIVMQFGGAEFPQWAGPAFIMCDETGEIPLVLQYLTSS